MVLLSRVLVKTRSPGKGGLVYITENEEEYPDMSLENEDCEKEGMSVLYAR